MALTAVRVDPPTPEMMPGPGGRLTEVWRLTGDGADLDVVITTDFIKRVLSAVGSGSWSHNITSATQNSFTVTFTAALGNNLTTDVWVEGKVSA